VLSPIDHHLAAHTLQHKKHGLIRTQIKKELNCYTLYFIPYAHIFVISSVFLLSFPTFVLLQDDDDDDNNKKQKNNNNHKWFYSVRFTHYFSVYFRHLHILPFTSLSGPQVPVPLHVPRSDLPVFSWTIPFLCRTPQQQCLYPTTVSRISESHDLHIYHFEVRHPRCVCSNNKNLVYYTNSRTQLYFT